jgi:mannose-6-phosphate isomerase-like protein (cupin superfamily)
MSQSPSPAKVLPGPEIQRFRRVVTGHDAQGQSIITSDAATPHIMPIMGQLNFAVTDFWKTFSTPPDKDWAAKAAAMGGAVAIDETAKSASKGGEVRHAHMHQTRSIDYAIVLSGEIWAVMDVGETKLVAGDVLVQRGTNHAWANRSNVPCVIAFVLLDAAPLS